MRRVVPKLLVISSQILIGALFVVFTLSSEKEINLKVNSIEMKRLSQFVYYEESNNLLVDVKNNDKLVEREDKEIKSELKIDNKNEQIVPEVKVENTIKEEKIEVEEIVEDNYFMDKEVLSSYTGILTGYGPDCVGCGNFNTNKVSTSSGYHIADIVDGMIQPAFTITYDDIEYGNVRIVAGDSTLPYNTIVRITIPDQEPIIAIVLDRGSTVGFENCRSSKGCLTNFDLLFPSEKDAMGKTYNVKFEILRMGI